ncbi:thioesterase II family protein [Catenovulum sediminis]|uniref:thioesterase II family protein n=1 Tax=Catenovulum sediminis TaxID=1740262 RepID=UPI00117CF7DF|nr:alpha/beta fold hydrolase [Catenovulum sediminis]
MNNPWLTLASQTPNAQATLFCLPYAGGSSAIFHPWRALLKDNIDLALVQLPGRGARFSEPAINDIELLSEQLFAAIRPHFSKPYFIFGHSMGGMLAYELVKRIEQAHLPMPQQLILSATRPPQVAYQDKTYHLPQAEFVEKLKTLNGTPDEILQNKELMALLLPMLKADFELAENFYQPNPTKIHCPTHVLCGTQDTRVPKKMLSKWSEVIAANCQFSEIPGGHLFLETATEALLRVINTELQAQLEKVSA